MFRSHAIETEIQRQLEKFKLQTSTQLIFFKEHYMPKLIYKFQQGCKLFCYSEKNNKMIIKVFDHFVIIGIMEFSCKSPHFVELGGCQQ